MSSASIRARRKEERNLDAWLSWKPILVVRSVAPTCPYASRSFSRQTMNLLFILSIRVTPTGKYTSERAGPIIVSLVPRLQFLRFIERRKYWIEAKENGDIRKTEAGEEYIKRRMIRFQWVLCYRIHFATGALRYSISQHVRRLSF